MKMIDNWTDYRRANRGSLPGRTGNGNLKAQQHALSLDIMAYVPTGTRLLM